MDPEFTKILIRVVIIGGLMASIGAVVLFFAIRAFRKGETVATALIFALLGFVLVCCILLLQFSFPR